METISRGKATLYEFGRDRDPVLTVEEGESFRVETWDAFEGALFEHGLGEFTTDDIPTLTSPPPAFDGNSVAGSIYVEGAEPGDTLAIHIEEISPERGFTTTLEEFGCLVGKSGWENHQVNYTHEVELKPGPNGSMTNGQGRLGINNHDWTWDLNAHIGTMATAPSRTVQETVTTRDHGTATWTFAMRLKAVQYI